MQWEVLAYTVTCMLLANIIAYKYNRSHTQQKRRGGEVRLLRLVPGRLAEYEVSGAEFSVLLWLNLTAAIALLLFWLGLHTQEDWVLATLLAALTLALLAKLHFKVKRETLLVESTLGVQLTTVFASGRRASLFVSRGRLRDVVIAEAISMHRVVTYLALVRRLPDGLVPLFRHTWPRRAQLEPVYRDVQRILRPDTPACEHGYSSS